MKDIESGIIITSEIADLVTAHNRAYESQKIGGDLEERAVLELAKCLADASAQAIQNYTQIEILEL